MIICVTLESFFSASEITVQLDMLYLFSVCVCVCVRVSVGGCACEHACNETEIKNLMNNL